MKNKFQENIIFEDLIKTLKYYIRYSYTCIYVYDVCVYIYIYTFYIYIQWPYAAKFMTVVGFKGGCKGLGL